MATVSALPPTDSALVYHTTRPNDKVTAHGAASAFKTHPHHTSLLDSQYRHHQSNLYNHFLHIVEYDETRPTKIYD